MSHFSSYPLLFAIMSGKHKQDYIGVFSATKIFLSAENIKTNNLWILKLQCGSLLLKCFLLLQDLDISSTGLKLHGIR